MLRITVWYSSKQARIVQQVIKSIQQISNRRTQLPFSIRALAYLVFHSSVFVGLGCLTLPLCFFISSSTLTSNSLSSISVDFWKQYSNIASLYLIQTCHIEIVPTLILEGQIVKSSGNDGLKYYNTILKYTKIFPSDITSQFCQS